MHCKNCEKEHDEQDNYCSGCGNDLTNERSYVATSGDHSVNFGNNNQVSGNSIHINSPQDPSDTAYINRTKITPASVAGVQIKAQWLVGTGLLSFLGSIASIAGFISSINSTFLFLMLSFGGILFPIGLVLIRHRNINFPPFFNLEANADGDIYVTKIEGECPKCTGQLKLRSVGPKNGKVTVVRCTRNPDHMWGFDPTVLDDL